MALGVYFAPVSMSTDQYDECIRRLNKARAGHPPGRRYHAAFGTGGTLQVFDVWDSQKAFDKFGQTLMPILQAIGVDPGQPAVTTIHNIIVPPAKAARAARAGARKRATRKKQPARRRPRKR